MIVILNMRDNKPNRYSEVHVTVDRSSVLGNPFYMCNSSDRDRVCDLYKRYFDALVANDTAVLNDMNISNERRTAEFRDKFMDKLAELVSIYKKHGSLLLYCWCAPRRCHAETIRSYILNNI